MVVRGSGFDATPAGYRFICDELNITWFCHQCYLTLLPMQKRSIQPGRPAGSTTYDAALAKAFGSTVRAARSEQGIAQETLAHKAGVERSHMGKVERGEHIPSLPLIFKIAGALGCSVATLLVDMESRLAASVDTEDVTDVSAATEEVGGLSVRSPAEK